MRFQGKLTLNDEGKLCLRMNLAQAGSFDADVELSEVFEEIIGKDVIIEIFEEKPWEAF